MHLNRLKKSGSQEGRGLALAGLVLGYLSVLLTLIAVVVLAFLFFGASSSALTEFDPVN